MVVFTQMAMGPKLVFALVAAGTGWRGMRASMSHWFG